MPEESNQEITTGRNRQTIFFDKLTSGIDVYNKTYMAEECQLVPRKVCRCKCKCSEKVLIPALVVLVFLSLSLLFAIIYTGLGRHNLPSYCVCHCPNDTAVSVSFTEYRTS